MVFTMNTQPLRDRPTGLDLKFARLARGTKAREVAGSLGVSPQRVSAIEAAYRPSAAVVARYIAALDEVASPENADLEPCRLCGCGHEVRP
jgi:transcriptional regulator with XRE-family HTH domain